MTKRWLIDQPSRRHMVSAFQLRADAAPALASLPPVARAANAGGVV
jgi:hypothetical protein